MAALVVPERRRRRRLPLVSVRPASTAELVSLAWLAPFLLALFPPLMLLLLELSLTELLPFAPLLMPVVTLGPLVLLEPLVPLIPLMPDCMPEVVGVGRLKILSTPLGGEGGGAAPELADGEGGGAPP